ncbi:MAG: ABC transporter ATP-binding protein [Nannocystaceae bacterium]|nr:ABC transporter ATP-binding protein [bacterium]
MRVELSAISKTYDGSTYAVRDVDLTIPSGSILGLIGPNGAGKSTALRMVATVMEPTRGTITYDGEVAGDPTAHQRLRSKIGFLGDGNPLYKDMTAAEYLTFFGQCFGLRGADLQRKVDDVLATFSLTHKADAKCKALSKGMRQRLLVARCLLHDPSLLILDEPADGLDPRGRSDLRTIVGQIRDRGVTIIISSHILRELDDLCDQVAILQRGAIVVSGNVGDIIERYEVSRLVYELRILSGLEQARAILAQRRVLIERESEADGLTALSLQVQGDDAAVADMLAELCGAGVRVVTCARVRSRLEDVYNRLSEDQVN